MKYDTRQFYRYVIPSMLVMFVAGLYSIVDGIFIGQATGSVGLAACAVTWPLFCVIFGTADLIGVGASILISQNQGARKPRRANIAFSQMVGLSVLASLLIPLVMIPLMYPILAFCGSSPDLIDLSYSYMAIVLAGSFTTILWGSLAAAMRNDQQPILAMWLSCLGVLANILFDYLFVMVFRWGLPGAAWATIVAELFPLLAAVMYFRSSKTHLTFYWRYTIPVWHWTWKILKYGTPSLGGSLAVSAMLLFHNWQAAAYGGGAAGLAIYAVIATAESLVSMVMQGLASGVQPLASYIHGTGDHRRNMRIAHLGIVFSLVLGGVGVLFSVSMCTTLPTLMGLTGQTAELATHGLLLSAPAFLVLGLVRFGCSFFQSTDKIAAANVLTYGDYCVVLPACLFLLPLWLNLDGVWLAMPVSRFILTVLLGFFWWWYYGRRRSWK